MAGGITVCVQVLYEALEYLNIVTTVCEPQVSRTLGLHARPSTLIAVWRAFPHSLHSLHLLHSLLCAVRFHSEIESALVLGTFPSHCSLTLVVLRSCVSFSHCSPPKFTLQHHHQPNRACVRLIFQITRNKLHTREGIRRPSAIGTHIIQVHSLKTRRLQLKPRLRPKLLTF